MACFYIDILPETLKAYTSDDSDSFKTIAVFDCRGYMPVEFEFLVNKLLYFLGIFNIV